MTKERGFTLVELLVALAVAIIVTSVMYSLYKVQNKTAIVQENVASMQQALRATSSILTRDLRMVGYDPEVTGNYGIEEIKLPSTPSDTNPILLEYTADLCEDQGVPADGADCQEKFEISYDGTGIIEYRIRGEVDLQPLVENVEFFELCYVKSDPTVCTIDVDDVDTISEREEIRAIKLSISLRSKNEDSNYLYDVSDTFTPGSGAAQAKTFTADGYRRRMIVETIELRNFGI